MFRPKVDRRSALSPVAAADVRVVLLDVEGTTTPVAFVYEELFPFARRRLPGYLDEHWHEAALQADVAQLEREHAAEPTPISPWTWDAPGVTRYALSLMDEDRKSTGLKSLQGRIWEEAYATGQLRGVVYEDVPRAFARWRAQGRRLGVFSSGSVLAQRLLFAHSTGGDLTPLIEAHFDTTTGPKRDAESYRLIAAALAAPVRSILFLSDVAAELDAARAAGLSTALCVRDATPPAASGHPVIRRFDEVLP
jgi:enolase-phosphatase E1